MSDEKVLTKEIAEQFIADEDSVDLSEFTAIEDDAAEVIGKLSVHPFFNGLNNTELPWIDLSNVRTLSAVALASLRPKLRQLADIFCQRMSEPLEELKNSGNSWLETSEDIAIAGFSALLGPWCDSSSADEVLSIWAKQPRTGNDVFGDSLTAHRLYFSVSDHFLDDDGKSDLTQFLNRFLDNSSWPSDEVTEGRDCVGDRGFYVPIDRLCEFITNKEWPHDDLCSCDSGALTLGITALSEEQATAVAAMTGKVFLNQVADITEAVADILAHGTAKVSLAGLKTIAPSEGHLLLLRMTADASGEELWLWQLEEVGDQLAQHLFDLCKEHDGLFVESPTLSDESLAILIRIQGYFGWGVRELSDSQTEILCQHNADLSLSELTSLSDEAATRLSQFPYGLSLDLEKIPSSAAEILRSHPSFAESEEDNE